MWVIAQQLIYRPQLGKCVETYGCLPRGKNVGVYFIQDEVRRTKMAFIFSKGRRYNGVKRTRRAENGFDWSTTHN
jgi:hypothetical protein